MAWDPVRDLLTMQERLESLFGHACPGWTPPVDLAETDDAYVITVELPGLSRSDVEIEFRDHVVTIRGARPADAVPTDRYHQLERGQGAFSRSFRFGVPVDGHHVTADLADGVLTVTAPKAGERRQIDIA